MVYSTRRLAMLVHRPCRSDLVLAPGPGVADDVDGEDRAEAAGRGHCSGTPALRMPLRTGSIWARYVGSSLIADQLARAREMEKAGLSARPALTAECASSSRSSCAREAANSKCGYGLFRLASIARRNHAAACSQLPRCNFATP